MMRSSLWRLARYILVLVFMFNMSCRNNPSSEILLKAGDALREGNVEEALSYYHKLTTLDPSSEVSQEAFYWIGEVYHLFKKQPKEAVEFYRKAVAQGNLTKYGEKSQKKIADIYYKDLKEYKKAIPEFQLLIDKFPGSKLLGEVQYQIGECYLSIGEYEQARIEYTALMNRYSTSGFRVDGAYRICVTYFREGDFQRARREYENFIVLYSDSPLVVNARLGLANVLEELGETDEALNQLAALEEEYPNREIILRKVDNLLKKKKALEKEGSGKK
jgi:TolA-binding protein